MLGTHIEQSGPYADWPIGTHFVPVETALELGRAHILELREAVSLRSGGAITQKAYRDFTTCGPHPKCNPVNRP